MRFSPPLGGVGAAVAAVVAEATASKAALVLMASRRRRARASNSMTVSFVGGVRTWLDVRRAGSVAPVAPGALRQGWKGAPGGWPPVGRDVGPGQDRDDLSAEGGRTGAFDGGARDGGTR
ncbi:hypothetical protein GCM10010230_25470 [Streptomyces narbonensis]|nr:hypothetical protein GCM10010230_25470 [Streptomyces narbonensis]